MSFLHRGPGLTIELFHSRCFDTSKQEKAQGHLITLTDTETSLVMSVPPMLYLLLTGLL